MLKILKNSYFSCLAVMLLCLSVPAFSALAQEIEVKQSLPTAVADNEPSEESVDVPSEEVLATKPVPGPKLQELEAYTAGLLRGLEPYQASYIYKIRQEFGVVRSVQIVRSDIQNAVESCGTENPDMRARIETRFEAWKDEILPKLAVADVALKDAIQRQGFRPTVRVNMLLDHVQAAFEERDMNIKKVPVTTAEACESLVKSLDNTEENLKTLLDSTTSALNKLSITPEETAKSNSSSEESETQVQN